MSKVESFKKCLIILLVCLVSGCASKKDNQVIDLKVERRAPDIAMQKCEDLEKLKDGKFETVVLKLQEVVSKYKVCEEKRKALETFINEEVK